MSAPVVNPPVPAQAQPAVVADPRRTLEGLLERSKAALQAVLPKHLTAERLMKLTLVATSRDRNLLACTPASILGAVMQSADLGLEPNTPLGLAYLIPFRNRKNGGRLEAQFLPSYKGLIRLAIQSGEVKSFRAFVVCEGDEFAVQYGTEPRIVHVPKFTGDRDDPAKLVAVYSIATYGADGPPPDFEVMTRAQVERIRQRSQSPNDGPWATDFVEMARKSVIRRHAKTLPLSSENLSRALHHQARAEAGDGPDFSDVTEALTAIGAEDLPAGAVTVEPPKPSAAATLKAKLKAENATLKPQEGAVS